MSRAMNFDQNGKTCTTLNEGMTKHWDCNSYKWQYLRLDFMYGVYLAVK